MNSLLIAGTDTDAGKTVLTSALAAYWQMYFPDRSLGIMKLLQTGTGDRELYTRLFALDQSPQELNPLHFGAPLAPPIAAEREGRHIELERSGRPCKASVSARILYWWKLWEDWVRL